MIKTISYYILVSLFIFSLLNVLKVLFSVQFQDFDVYYFTAQEALAHRNFYITSQSLGGFLYPPFSIFYFIPLTFFPLLIAGKIWTVISLIVLVISLYIIIKKYIKKTNRLLLMLLGIGILWYFPLKFTLGMGQINAVILLLLTMFVVYYKRNKILSGMFLGVVISTKVFPILIVLYLLFRRNFTILASTIITIIFLFLGSVLFFGMEPCMYYLQQTLPAMTFSQKIDYYNQALTGFIFRSFPNLTLSSQQLLWGILSMCMVLITFITIMNTGNKKNVQLDISTLITLNLLISPFSWQHHFLLLLLPYLLMLFLLHENNYPKWYTFFLAISFALTAINLKNPEATPYIMQSHVYYGAMLLWILEIVLLARKKL